MASWIKKILVISTLTRFGSVAAADRCPLLVLKDAEVCHGLSSECWTPGEDDIDCPNNGLCCFDGCVNRCGIPPEPPTPIEPECVITPETVTEEVPEEVCTEIPPMETCTKFKTTECEHQCQYVDKPDYVNETTTCCTKSQVLRCLDAPCPPGEDKTVPLEKAVCKKGRKECFTVPEQVCHNEEVEECVNVPVQDCSTRNNSPFMQGLTHRCTSRIVKTNCRQVPRRYCPVNAHVHNKKSHHFFHKKAGFLKKRDNCFNRYEEVCDHQTVTDCGNSSPDCRIVNKNVCTKKVEPKCENVEKEQCVGSDEDVCDVTVVDHTIFVPYNCDKPDKECFYEDVEDCEDIEKQVETTFPEKVCEDVCKPVENEDCVKSKPSKDCKIVFKTMAYTVSVQKCA